MISSSYFDFSEGVPDHSHTFTDIQMLPSAGFCFIAKANRDGKWFFIKGLKEAYRHQEVYREALRKEYDILESLQHPNVASVDSFEEVGDMGMCIVMEYIKGHSLREALAIGMTNESKIKIVHELLDALEYVHKKQIVHRDIKPSNIMITDDGAHVKLVDFGLSDSNSYSFLKQPSGTEDYVSPEQKVQPVPDARNDIYSLGCVIGRMKLGRSYNRIIVRCKKPIAERYQHVGMLREAFDRAGRPSPFRWVFLSLLLFLAVGLAGVHYHWIDDVYALAKSVCLTNYVFCEDGMCYNILSDEELTVEVVHDNDALYCGDITVPDSVVHNGITYTVVRLGNEAFRDCAGLEAVVLPQTIRSIGDSAFINCTGLATLNMPDSIAEVGNNLLRQCTYVRSVRLPQTLTEVPPYCFSGCSNLRYVHLHEGLTTLQRDAFGDSGLDSIALPASLRTIERGVFWGCKHLKKVYLPATIQRIGDFVFWHCDSLTDVYVEHEEPLRVTNIFQNLKGVKLHVPKGARNAYSKAEGWKVLNIIEE